MKGFIGSTLFVLVSILLGACAEDTPPSITDLTDVFTPTPQAIESTPDPTSLADTARLFSNDQLELCFSYPPDYTPYPANDRVEIAAPDLPGNDVKGLFWLEVSESLNRTAEEISDQDMNYAVTQQGVPIENLDRWTIALGGEHAVVLDGMPGQNLQRRLYVVHEETLYVLVFWPTRSENQAADDQMEALYTAVTNSWLWSPCGARE